MSHIIRFSVTGLAGHATPYSHELHRDLNIFFGLNGTGKTSLLKILHSALSQKAASLASVPFQHAEVTIFSLKYEQEFTSVIEKKRPPKLPSVARKKRAEHPELIAPDLLVDPEEPLKWVYTTPLPANFEVVGPWQSTYLPTWRLQPQEQEFHRYALDPRRHPVDYDWDEFFARSLQQLWSAYSTRILSALQSIQSEGLVSILKSIMKSERPAAKRGKFDADVAFNRVRAFLSRQGAVGILESQEHFEQRYNENDQLRHIVDNINSIEQRVEDTKSARNSLERLITDMFIGTKKVVFEDTNIRVMGDDGNPIQLASLSSGEKQAMLIFIDTLLAAESALLIDEPEISLHVDWQRRLISNMKLLNPNAQIIVATHSPEIMADIPDEKIFRL